MEVMVSSNSVALALKQFRASPAAKDVNFTVKYFPYQLYPDASTQGEDKYEWYDKLYCKLEQYIYSCDIIGTRQQNTTTPKSR